MFTNPATPAPTYSTLGTGTRVKILATVTTDGQPTSRTVATLHADQATAAAEALAEVADQRGVMLHLRARALQGQVCYLRRTLMAALADGSVDERLPSPAWPLLRLAATLPEAVRRALADEVGRLLEGTEDVLVPVDLTDEFGGPMFLRVANSWLALAGDDELTECLDGEDDAVLFEGLLAQLRSEDTDIDAACDHAWVDVRLDDDLLAAWVRRHRPHLLVDDSGDDSDD